MPSAALQQQRLGEIERSPFGGLNKSQAGGDAIAIGGMDDLSPLGSARFRDAGIEMLIGMVDAAIVA